MLAAVVEFDDARYKAVNAHGHDDGDADQHRYLRDEGRGSDGPEGDDNDLGQAIFSSSWILTIARNITQTIECDQSSNVSLLASLRINAC